MMKIKGVKLVNRLSSYKDSIDPQENFQEGYKKETQIKIKLKIDTFHKKIKLKMDTHMYSLFYYRRWNTALQV